MKNDNIYISKGLKGNRKVAPRYYGDQLSKINDMVGDLFKGIKKPRILIVSPKENVIFLRGDIKNDHEVTKTSRKGKIRV